MMCWEMSRQPWQCLWQGGLGTASPLSVQEHLQRQQLCPGLDVPQLHRLYLPTLSGQLPWGQFPNGKCKHRAGSWEQSAFRPAGYYPCRNGPRGRRSCSPPPRIWPSLTGSPFPLPSCRLPLERVAPLLRADLGQIVPTVWENFEMD